MKKVFGLGLVFALCLHLPTAAIPTQQVAVKSFATWCQERNSVAVTTRHTIDVLLKEADTENPIALFDPHRLNQRIRQK